MKNNYLKKIMTILTIIITLFLILFIIYGIKEGIFKSRYVLISKIRKFGLLGPFFFLLLQVIQVIFPVIPGGMSCLAGVLAFGSFFGFLYNYIGLSIGSYLAYFLSKTFGLLFLYKLFSSETIEKYLKYIKNKKFEKIFFFGILLPGAPDDLLCYIAGISGMSVKRFMIIILLCKPLTLIFYSLFPIYFLS